MAEFSGIRNENEFYFAHYLTSLMDDELKEVCQTDEMKSAFEAARLRGGGSSAIITRENAEDGRQFFEMNGMEVWKQEIVPTP